MAARRVPWKDWAEWEEVRTGLTGTSPAARDAALISVHSWQTLKGRVPHAVEVKRPKT